MKIVRTMIFVLLVLNVPIQAIYVNELEFYHRVSNAKVGFCIGMMISGIGLWTQAIAAQIPLPQCLKMPTLNDELQTPSMLQLLCLPCYFAFLGAIGRSSASIERAVNISMAIVSTVQVLGALSQRRKEYNDAENLEKNKPCQLIEVTTKN